LFSYSCLLITGTSYGALEYRYVTIKMAFIQRDWLNTDLRVTVNMVYAEFHVKATGSTMNKTVFNSKLLTITVTSNRNGSELVLKLQRVTF